MTNARRAAAEVVALDLPVTGRLNNVGIMPMTPCLPDGAKRAARVIIEVLTAIFDSTLVYDNEKGTPMLASAQVRDLAFSDQYVAETRALLSTGSSVA
jgi:hypothetical protein